MLLEVAIHSHAITHPGEKLLFIGGMLNSSAFMIFFLTFFESNLAFLKDANVSATLLSLF